MKQDAKPSIYQVTGRIINLIANDLEASSTKAIFANLRQSINKNAHLATGVFPIVFSNMPTEYLGKHGNLTVSERSVISALQVFALHQQGKSYNVNLQSDSKSKTGTDNLGASLSSLRGINEDSKSIDRRFNAMINSTNFTELENHLRHMVKLLKSKTDVKINYPQLAQDLFWFQKGQQSNVRLKWSRSYYRYYDNKGDESNE